MAGRGIYPRAVRKMKLEDMGMIQEEVVK